MQSKRVGFIVAGVIGVAFVLTTVLVVRCTREGKLTGPGSPTSSEIVRSGERRVVILVDVVRPSRTGSETRITAVDGASGTRLATRRSLPAGTTCTAAINGRMWCGFQRDMKLLDAATLADVAIASTIVKRDTGRTWQSMRAIARDGSLHGTSTDGHRLRVDAMTVTAAPGPEMLGPARPALVTTDAVTIDGIEYRFTGPVRRRLTKAGSPTGDELLSPMFLVQGGQPVRIGADLVVEHRETTDPSSKVLLSRMTLDGNVRWRTPLRGRTAAIDTSAEPTIVVTQDGSERALGIASDTGAVLWRTTF